jgi:hypothetical protein
MRSPVPGAASPGFVAIKALNICNVNPSVESSIEIIDAFDIGVLKAINAAVIAAVINFVIGQLLLSQLTFDLKGLPLGRPSRLASVSLSAS